MACRISGDEHLWPDGVVPYEIDDDDYPDGSPGRVLIMSAIGEWNARTNITFIPRMFDADYVVFRFGDDETASSSPVGRVGGAQTIRAATLGFSAGAIVHEIGHAIGLHHEQAREDRDRFIAVNLPNVRDDRHHNFTMHVDDGDDVGPYDYSSIMHYGRNVFAKDVTIDTLTPISWFGHENEGGGLAFGDISRNGQQDLVIFHVDNPEGANTGYYRILWNVDAAGIDQGGLSDFKRIPGWMGDETQGGGIALHSINGDGTLDLIVFFIDKAAGGNQGYYKIGWNLGANGDPASWSEPMKVPGGFGSSNQAAGVTTAFVRGLDRPDLIVFHIDDPGGANTGYYRIGWSMGVDGTIRDWTAPMAIPDWFGDDNQGGGIAVADLTNSGRPSLVVFHIDNPEDENRGYIRVGRNLNPSGIPANGWTAPIPVPGWFGHESHGGDIAIADLAGTGTKTLVVFHLDNPDGANRGYYRVGTGLNINGNVAGWSNVLPVHNIGVNAAATIGTAGVLSPLDIAAVNGMYPAKSAAGLVLKVGGLFGTETQGSDVALGDISGNGRPDLLVFYIDHPDNGNKGYYRIGWDLDNNGFVATFTSAIPVDGWFGNETQGAGVALANIGKQAALDLVIFHIDHPAGGNKGYYRIGWDLNAAGIVQGGWTGPLPVDGWFGNDNQGGAIAVADINKSGMPDLIVVHVDNPDGANQCHYRIGWNVDGTGNVTKGWSDAVPIPGWFGNDTQGVGVAVADVDGDGFLDLVVLHLDDPSGGNRGYYRIGRKLDTVGNVTGGWSRAIPIAGWFGNDNQGAGIASFDITGDGRQDFVVVHMDNPSGDNRAYYRSILTPLLA